MSSFGHLDAPLDPHGLCGEVGVSSSSVPVTSHRLGVERHHDTKVLRHPLRNAFAFLLSHFLRRQTWRRYLLTQRSSPISIPSVGPTWYSHWAGITSALVPETLDESIEIGNV